MYRRFFKRFLDILLATIGFSILFPLFVVIFLILLFLNRGTPFFTQVRPGKNGRLFSIIKFKTMNDRTGGNGVLLAEEFRITPVGRFIRKYSLDEIPQLLNVIFGDMSLIGPRPLLPDYLPLYNEFQNRRHEVRPGITGWAQINGRNAVSWDERFRLDVWYVDHLNFLLDCRIIFSTFRKVLKNEGGSPEDSVVMKRFMGNSN